LLANFSTGTGLTTTKAWCKTRFFKAGSRFGGSQNLDRALPSLPNRPTEGETNEFGLARSMAE
jgi:hypothetical protein